MVHLPVVLRLLWTCCPPGLLFSGWVGRLPVFLPCCSSAAFRVEPLSLPCPSLFR